MVVFLKLMPCARVSVPLFPHNKKEMFCSGERQHIYASKCSLTKRLEPKLLLLVQEFWSIKQNQVSRASSLQSLRKMKNSMEITCFAFLGLLFLQRIAQVSSSSPLTNSNQASEGSAGSGTLKQEEERAFEVHCSRERSRTAWKIIEDYLMPFMEQERYQISNKCRLHPDNDIFRDQEQHKIHVDMNEWQCGYCKKSFRAEKFLDQHFDNRHQNLLNVSGSKCIADLCGALHCDHVMHTKSRKTKCNPVAVARNRHICESLADDCFPIQQGASASHLHELFLHQFCNALTCSGKPKPFSRGGKEQTSVLYLALSILTLMLLPLFYVLVFLHQREMKMRSQELRRIPRVGRKTKPS